MSEFYKLNAHKPNGELLKMADNKGKVVLIVNTATQCGLTPQFTGLEELHKKYQDQGLIVLGFPCNQFGSQEPLDNDEMTQTCEINHGVTFQLTEKVDVNGEQTHPIFALLKGKLGTWLGRKIKWNFTKFIIDKNGNPTKRFSPTTKPQKLEKDIVALLKA